MNEERPNWLFLLSDQHRWDWLGLYGNEPVRTPNIDALAERGICFTQAVCTSPLCAPSRASLASGRRPHRTGVPNNEFDYPPDIPTYYSMLRETGYRVGAVGKTDLHKRIRWYGLDGWTEFCGKLGFTETVDSAGKWDAVRSGWPKPQDPYMAYLHRRGLAEMHVEDFRAREQARGVTAHPTPLNREDYSDDWIARNGVRMLREFPRDSPWHLTVNFTGPHEPFDAPAELLDKWRGVEFSSPYSTSEEEEHFADEENQAIRRNYAAMVEGIDEWVGRFVEEVVSRGESARTFIVYSSDHGEMLGERGLWGKEVMYEPSIRIPLIVSGAQVARAGSFSSALVELPDLPATFLDMVGIDAPEDWDAKSFSRVLSGETEAHRAAQISNLNSRRMIFDGKMKLIDGGDTTELYDLHADPQESTDLIGSHPEEVQRLRQALQKALNA